MRVYLSRPRSPRADDFVPDDPDEPFRPHLTVFEPDGAPHYTGILDKEGNDLVAFETREPVGFLRLRER